jgi:hypothetical protein
LAIITADHDPPELRALKSLRNYRKEWDEDRATFRDPPVA